MMDMAQPCHHCGATIGFMCMEHCSVNGRKIRIFHGLLKRLNLEIVRNNDNWILRQIPRRKMVFARDYNEEGRFTHR